MYGKPFNEKRPFGTVMGVANHVYEQDGFLYNGQKECVDIDGKPLPMMPSTALPPGPETPVIVVPPDSNPEDDVPEDEKPFNILAWAQGDETLKSTPWPKVRAEAATLLGDGSGLTSKEAARKAVLAHYGL